MQLLSEKARDVLAKINEYLPKWAEFTVKEFKNSIYQATIVIESDYYNPVKLATESTCLEMALEQMLKMLELYYVYKEEDSEQINELMKELKEDGII